MSHPNRNWKRRWVVDPVARKASHVDGWVFQFDAEPSADGGLEGRCTAHPNLIGYNTVELPRTAARIAREAGEIYMERTRVRKNDDQHD